MNAKTHLRCNRIIRSSVLLAFTFFSSISFAETPKDSLCPPFGWSEHLNVNLDPKAKIPTENTPIGASDCDFHEWSWEAYIWATALVEKDVPRFMMFPTPDDLLSTNKKANQVKTRSLRLGTRSLSDHDSKNPEVAGAIVEADGNMMVAKNGYPVYASVHMNPAYFDVAKRNLITTGDYMKNVGTDDYFPVGAAVFKATWLRLDDIKDAPDGAFVTDADVPVLQVVNNYAVPKPDKFVKVKVALVGLHVVGITINHPEFLWATFEHKNNAPMIPDNTFSTTMTPSDQDFTFYKKNTPYTEINIPNQDVPAVLSFDEKTQKFSPATNTVQENATGGENFSPNGPQNIANLNTGGQTFLANVKKVEQRVFANYNLIGTVWMPANTYVKSTPGWWNLNQTNAQGSVNLANTTAETFQQYPTNTDMSKVQNCFMCHNPQSYPQTAVRRVAISHVLSANEPSPFSVPNQIPVCYDKSAGAIFSDGEAKTKCPTVCATEGKWNGQWKTVVQGQESVCGCCAIAPF